MSIEVGLVAFLQGMIDMGCMVHRAYSVRQHQQFLDLTRETKSLIHCQEATKE